MIGTTLKLGFDGTSVARGLGNVSTLMGKFGKQVAIGATRRIGEGMTDMLGRIVTALPAAIKETADWAGNLTDMATQTGVSVAALVTMEEALRLSGAQAADTSRIISVLADNLNNASVEGSPAAEALKALGMEAEELKGMKIDEAFYKIGKRVAELNKTTKTPITFLDEWGQPITKIIETTEKMEGLETVMSDLFGAKMGYKLIRFFKDFDGSMGQAENNVGKLGDAIGNGLAVDMDNFSDSLGRFETLKRSLSSIVLSEIFRATGGANGMNRLFDFLDPEKIRPQIESFVSMIGRNLEVLLSQDLTTSIGDLMKNLGKSFGEGIRDSLKISVKDFLPSFGGGAGTSTKDGTGSLIEDTNSILTDIRKNTLTSFFN